MKHFHCDLMHKPDVLLKLNPSGEVPVLQLPGEDGTEKVIAGSDEVVEAILPKDACPEFYAEPPGVPAGKANECVSLIPFLARICKNKDEDKEAELIQALREKLAELDKVIAGSTADSAEVPWFGGQSFMS